MRTRRCWSLLLATVLFTLTACGSSDFTRRIAAPWKTLHDKCTAPSPPSPSEQTAALRQNIRRQLETENYRSALNLLRREIKGGLPEAALAEEYVMAVNGALDRADRYGERGQPEKAGELFRSAYDGFPEEKAVAKRVRLTPAKILVHIDDCAGQLMDRGLVAYRGGDLDGAIRIWKMIIAFHPQHQASLKALKTAEVQRANLEKVSAQ